MELPLLHLDNLSVDFVTEDSVFGAVKNVSLSIHAGEILALVGESGSGKSVTSLSVLQLLPKPPAKYSSGKILLREKDQTTDLLTLTAKELQRVRGNKISMIFQEPMTSLNPVISCGKQVMEALLAHRQLPKAVAKRQTIEWFEKVKLPDPEKIFDRYPHQLSGGQKQRVMIAMAMCCEPKVLICDEPTTALDVTVQKTILSLIKDLQTQRQMGVLFITHDLGVVAQIADRVAIMYKGEIVEEGSATQIFNHAAHPYTKALIACRPAAHEKGDKLPTVSDFLDTHSEIKVVEKKQAPSQSSTPAEPVMEVKNLSVLFPTNTSLFGKPKSFVTAVNKISFDVLQNETLGLVGESGCGKTTVGRTLLRLIEPTSGSIFYNGEDLTKLSTEGVKKLRKDVQLIFQDPYSSLNPRLTIGAALAEPMKVAGIETSARERKKKVAELLEKVSLPSTALSRYPHEFSGGQRQRIVIARALGLNPNFLVCDESVSALDVSVQAQVLNLLNDLKKELGLTLLFISHDLSVVRYMCDRIVVMQAGNIVEQGTTEAVYTHPKTAYTQALLDAVPKIGSYKI